jgi:hypothetical protein
LYLSSSGQGFSLLGWHVFFPYAFVFVANLHLLHHLKMSLCDLMQVNQEGRGPAWANSLFEDNAQFGLGISMGVKQRREALVAQVKAIVANGVGSPKLREAFEEWTKVSGNFKICYWQYKMVTALTLLHSLIMTQFFQVTIGPLHHCVHHCAEDQLVDLLS